MLIAFKCSLCPYLTTVQAQLTIHKAQKHNQLSSIRPVQEDPSDPLNPCSKLINDKPESKTNLGGGGESGGETGFEDALEVNIDIKEEKIEFDSTRGDLPSGHQSNEEFRSGLEFRPFFDRVFLHYSDPIIKSLKFLEDFLNYEGF